MPRNNRQNRALNHKNPLVGCIMTIQKKIKWLSHSVIGCKCVTHESEISSLHEKVGGVENKLSSVCEELTLLRNELSALEEKYKSLSKHNKLLCTFIFKSGDQYRERIKILNLDYFSEIIQGICRDKAYREEIISLRSEVSQLKEILSEHNIPQPSSSSSPCTWVLDAPSKFPIWNVNKL